MLIRNFIKEARYYMELQKVTSRDQNCFRSFSRAKKKKYIPRYVSRPRNHTPSPSSTIGNRLSFGTEYEVANVK
jgi:hypothetical protein